MGSNALHIIGSLDPRCLQLGSVLQESGWKVTISDESNGWKDSLITKDLEGVIITNGITSDNPELIAAASLKISIYSFAGFIRQLATDKQRIVITGSHGLRKTIAIVIHILKYYNRTFDYSLSYKNNEHPPEIKLSDAPYILLQGSEVYDQVGNQPEFMTYEHHIGLLNGIDMKKSALPGINEPEYASLFRKFADSTPKGGVLLYNELDPVVKSLFHEKRTDVVQIPFVTPKYEYKNGSAVIHDDYHKPLTVALTGSRNMLYINAAKELVKKLGVSSDKFYDALPSYEPKQKLS